MGMLTKRKWNYSLISPIYHLATFWYHAWVASYAYNRGFLTCLLHRAEAHHLWTSNFAPNVDQKSLSDCCIDKFISERGKIIIYQIFSLVRDCSKRVTWPNIPQLKLWRILPYFQNCACCEKYFWLHLRNQCQ